MRLRNPHTIRIYDFGRTADGAMYMAMELLEGKPLDKHIKDLLKQGRTMTQYDAAMVGIQVLKSLAEAHALGMVHRDLKPGNVFITDDGSGELLAKVLDFGIARVQDSSMTSTGKILGTPAYMAPEQWRSEAVDARADVYAAGGMLYCCVTGAPPFHGDGNPMALMYQHFSEPVGDPRAAARESLTDDFVQILHAALAKQAKHRFADARAMRLALEAVVAGKVLGHLLPARPDDESTVPGRRVPANGRGDDTVAYVGGPSTGPLRVAVGGHVGDIEDTMDAHAARSVAQAGHDTADTGQQAGSITATGAGPALLGTPGAPSAAASPPAARPSGPPLGLYGLGAVAVAAVVIGLALGGRDAAPTAQVAAPAATQDVAEPVAAPPAAPGPAAVVPGPVAAPAPAVAQPVVPALAVAAPVAATPADSPASVPAAAAAPVPPKPTSSKPRHSGAPKASGRAGSGDPEALP